MDQKWTYFLNRIAILLILQYQKLTLNKKHKCLFFPSCSDYGILAYKKYPFILATKKIISRFRDCHPFSNRDYLDYP